uniref:Uncharacterized protein n=1 Tax=Brassica campestris TaxID=3711 RepID=M4E7G3_BRACM
MHLRFVPQDWMHLRFVPQDWMHLRFVPQDWMHLRFVPQDWMHLRFVPQDIVDGILRISARAKAFDEVSKMWFRYCCFGNRNKKNKTQYG